MQQPPRSLSGNGLSGLSGLSGFLGFQAEFLNAAEFAETGSLHNLFKKQFMILYNCAAGYIYPVVKKYRTEGGGAA